MKRKGRQSTTKSEAENGVSVAEEDTNVNEEQPEERKRKSAKRNSKNVKNGEEAEESNNEATDKRKSSKGKGKNKNAKKALIEDESDQESTDRDEEINDKKKSAISKGRNTKPNSDSQSDVSDSGEYEVEKVLDEKMIKGVKHFLIRWKGYEPESDTWEPESTLDCSELIAEFKSNSKKKDKTKSKGRAKKRTASDAPEDTWNEDDDFEVDRILDVYFRKDGTREFLVSWKGYSSSQNSWEPESNMDCKDLITKFMNKVEKAKQADSKELRVNRKHTERFTLSPQSKQRRLSKRQEGKQRVTYHDAE